MRHVGTQLLRPRARRGEEAPTPPEAKDQWTRAPPQRRSRGWKTTTLTPACPSGSALTLVSVFPLTSTAAAGLAPACRSGSDAIARVAVRRDRERVRAVGRGGRARGRLCRPDTGTGSTYSRPGCRPERRTRRPSSVAWCAGGELRWTARRVIAGRAVWPRCSGARRGGGTRDQQRRQGQRPRRTPSVAATPFPTLRTSAL